MLFLDVHDRDLAYNEEEVKVFNLYAIKSLIWLGGVVFALTPFFIAKIISECLVCGQLSINFVMDCFKNGELIWLSASMLVLAAVDNLFFQSKKGKKPGLQLALSIISIVLSAILIMIYQCIKQTSIPGGVEYDYIRRMFEFSLIVFGTSVVLSLPLKLTAMEVRK